MKKYFASLVMLLISTSTFANLTDELSQLTGYSIVGSKTISGWYDKNGNSGDSFEGCDFDRVIVFSDNKIITCQSYGYQYAYMPKAVILHNGSQLKMIVQDKIYNMTRE